jgi:hypothetical protein
MRILYALLVILLGIYSAYLYVQRFLRLEGIRRRKIHLQTLFPGNNDRHLNE